MFDPSDFHKTKDDRDKAVSEVSHYLEEEEKWLLDSILQAFHINLEEEDVIAAATGPSRFAHVVDAVVERIDQISNKKLAKLTTKEFDVVVAHINAAFRHYEEILESCAAQLFHELEKIRVDALEQDTLKGVELVHQRMLGQVDNCVDQIRRLEKKLGECAGEVQGKWSLVNSVSRFFRSVLDKSIIAKLKKIKQMVTQGYQQLQRRYSDYQRLNKAASARIARLAGFQVFRKLPAETQQEFTEIYRILKIRELNPKHSDVLGLELDRVLKDTVTVDEAHAIFAAYFTALESSIFILRRDLTQTGREQFAKDEFKQTLNERVQASRREVATLGSLVMKFRDFVLSTHPDPYVRARLGFSERTVGPEPEETRSLAQLGLKVENLDKRFVKLGDAVEEYDPQTSRGKDLGYFDELIGDLERLSWEAKTRDEAILYYKTFLGELQEVQELYSFDPFRVMGMEKVLRLALRLDHFHVLIDDRRLCELYDTHVRIRGKVPDIEQAKRLKKLAEINDEMSGLKTSTASLTQSARSIAKGKAEVWKDKADEILGSLEAFIQEMRAKIPLPLEELLDTVSKRRYEVLEFLYSYHTLASRLGQLDVPVPEDVKRLMDRVHKIEGDFAYLTAHHERAKGPMDMNSLKALESL